VTKLENELDSSSRRIVGHETSTTTNNPSSLSKNQHITGFKPAGVGTAW